MSAIPRHLMTVDEFLVWAEAEPGRFELHDGVIVALSPERIRHVETKGEVWLALRNAISRAKMDCHALTDGATVRIGKTTAFEPDALVYCGKRIAGGQVEVPQPIIAVEVLSPGNSSRDIHSKLAGYFSLTSLHHCLIIDAEKRMVIHHKRGAGDLIETRILIEGMLRFDPPGLELSAAEFFAATPDGEPVSAD